MRPYLRLEECQKIVPSTVKFQVHPAGGFVGGAVDIYAAPGSRVRAPADGYVVEIMDLSLNPDTKLFGYQIRGFFFDRRDREIGFVMAHFQRRGLIATGDPFEAGDPLGGVAFWPEYPKSSHVHVALRVGDGRMPPPGNIKIERGLRRL